MARVAEHPIHPTRSRLVAAATELFARDGFHGTGVAEILASSGVSRGSFYHFFKSKQDVLYDVCLIPLDHMCLVASRIAANGTPAADRFRQLASALLADIAQNQAAWRVYLRDSAYLTGQRQERIKALRDRFEMHWGQIIDAGAEAGIFPALEPLEIKGILGMFNHAVLWLDPVGSVSTEQLSRQFCDILLNGLLQK